MNQSLSPSTDIFHTNLMKPPTSALVIPLRNKTVIYGAMFAMSCVQTDFADMSWKLRELWHIIGPYVHHILTNVLTEEYQVRGSHRMDVVRKGYKGSGHRMRLSRGCG
jgi:hypothetical protein